MYKYSTTTRNLFLHEYFLIFSIYIFSIFTISDMARDLFQRTIDFMRKECEPYCSSASSLKKTTTDSIAGLYEVKIFTSLFGSFLDRHFNREKLSALEAEKDKEKDTEHSAAPKTVSPAPKSDILGDRNISTSLQPFGSMINQLLPGNYLQMIRNSFIYSYIWSFGSNLNPAYAFASSFYSITYTTYKFTCTICTCTSTFRINILYVNFQV